MILNDYLSKAGWSHMISTLPGEEGHKELMDFATKIGMNHRWLQKSGTAEEHFDIKASKYALARDHGSTLVSSKIIVRHIQEKREHFDINQLNIE